MDEIGPPPDAAAHASSTRPRWLRGLYAGAGWLCVGLGVVGLFLPFMPGTVFLILAAACFTRSSPRFEDWLVNHARLGPSVRAWRAERAIPRPAKWFACLSLVASSAILGISPAPLFAKIGAAAFFLAVAAWIVSRPEPRAAT